MAFSNTISLATKYAPLFDELYEREVLTKDLEVNPVEWAGANAIKVFKYTAVSKLKNYNRDTGFAEGGVTGAWETLTLGNDRGMSFQIDYLDNEETLDQGFGKLAVDFMKKVGKEIDMYRFGKIASASNIQTTDAAVLDEGSEVVAAIDVAEAALANESVPVEECILYINPIEYNLLKGAAGSRIFTDKAEGVNRNITTYDGMKIVVVPKSRFGTATQYDSSTKEIEWHESGSPAAVDAKYINFLIVHPAAVMAVAKREKLRVFSPDQNQDADAYKLQYRLVHDCFVLDQKVKGIYLHKDTSSPSN